MFPTKREIEKKGSLPYLTSICLTSEDSICFKVEGSNSRVFSILLNDWLALSGEWGKFHPHHDHWCMIPFPHSLYQKPPKWRDLFSNLFLQQVAIRQCLGRSNEFTLVPTYTKLYAYFEGHPGILSPHPWGLGIFHRFHWKPNHPQIPLTSTGPTPASQETRVMENLLIMGMTFAGKKHQNHGWLLFLGPFLLFFLLLWLLLLLLSLLSLSSCFVDRGKSTP